MVRSMRPRRPEVGGLSRREILVLAPLVAFMILLGVYPRPLLERTEPTVVQLLQTVEQRRAAGPGVIGLRAARAPEQGRAP